MTLFGEHGCHLGAWVRPESSTPPVKARPICRFPSLGLLGHTWISAGDDASPGFEAEIGSIFYRRMRVLWELEAKTTRESYSSAITRVLQGIVDDIGSIRGKYPELAGWDLSVTRGSGCCVPASTTRSRYP